MEIHYNSEDIRSKKISNLYPHEFIFEGVKCASMESFLQSLKLLKSDTEAQSKICKMAPFEAKKWCKKMEDWKREQELWWKGKAYPRDSVHYNLLIDRAYLALLDCSKDFRKALSSTEHIPLEHSIGKKYKHETVLTEEEFCNRLLKLRALIRFKYFDDKRKKVEDEIKQRKFTKLKKRKLLHTKKLLDNRIKRVKKLKKPLRD